MKPPAKPIPWVASCSENRIVESGKEWRDERSVRKVDVERPADPVCSLGGNGGRCLTRRNIRSLSFKCS